MQCLLPKITEGSGLRVSDDMPSDRFPGSPVPFREMGVDSFNGFLNNCYRRSESNDRRGKDPGWAALEPRPADELMVDYRWAQHHNQTLDGMRREKLSLADAREVSRLTGETTYVAQQDRKR